MANDLRFRKAKHRDKPYKLYESNGLFMLVTPTAKLWRMKFRLRGREGLMSFGIFPAVSFATARANTAWARECLDAGIDPRDQIEADANAEKDQQAAQVTFETVAREWFAIKENGWATSHSEKILGRLRKFAFPEFGSLPIQKVDRDTILAALRKIEANGSSETAHRTLQVVRQVYKFAQGTGCVDRDPTVGLLQVLKPIGKFRHFPAITDLKALGPLLRGIDGYPGTFPVKAALQILPHVFTRPGELQWARWSEFDFEKGDWLIPAERTKMRRPLLVPLSTQILAILWELRKYTGNPGPFLFPSLRTTTAPMSENTLNAALRRLGYSQDELVAHGFRATARTLLDEVLHFRIDLIEHQLGHAVRDPLGRAYNRTQYLVERRQMMQKWSDFLDGLKNGTNVVVPITAAQVA